MPQVEEETQGEEKRQPHPDGKEGSEVWSPGIEPLQQRRRRLLSTKREQRRQEGEKRRPTEEGRQ